MTVSALRMRVGARRTSHSSRLNGELRIGSVPGSLVRSTTYDLREVPANIDGDVSSRSKVGDSPTATPWLRRWHGVSNERDCLTIAPLPVCTTSARQFWPLTLV